MVTTPGGSATLSGGFTYVAFPTVASISPSSGPIVGGTAVTINGTGFVSGNTTVTIGGNSATGIIFGSTTSITVITPAGTTGAQDVVVTTPGGSATLPRGFTYAVPAPAPTLTSISPTSGTTAGGTGVTITGTGFYAGGSSAAVSAVTFGGANATNYTVTSDTSITATTPAGMTGAQDVVVATPGGSATLPGGFTYVAASYVVGGWASAPAVVTGVGSVYVGNIVSVTGVFTQSATLQSLDGNSTVSIAIGTIGKTMGGLPLSTITVTPQSTPPAPPTSSNIVAFAYDFGPNGATFNPPITMIFRYSLASIPAGVPETSMVVAFYDTAAGQWAVLASCIVDPVAHTITVPVSHFTLFTVMASMPKATPTATPTPTTTLIPIATPTPMTTMIPMITQMPTPLPSTPTPPASNAPLASSPPSTTTAGGAAAPLNVGLIVGIIVACLAVLLLILILIRRRK